MSFNKKMLTVEDANSVINHFNKGFADYYILDTSDLTTSDTWFAYDFIDVYRVTGSISFNVKNSLWTGGFRIIDSNISSPTVNISGNSIVVTGTGLEWVILVLEISPEFNYNKIVELDYTLEYEPVIMPVYEDFYLTMGFFDNETPIVSMDVTDKITGETLTTDNTGSVTVQAPLNPINRNEDYDYTLECVNNNEVIDYNFPYKRIQVELPVILLNDNVYRDKTNILEFKFLFDEEYNITEEMLFNDNNIRLKANGNYYNIKEYNTDTFTFEIPVDSAYSFNMEIIISGNDFLEDYTVNINKVTEYIGFDTVSALKDEIESDNSAKTVLFTGTVFDETINIDKDIKIMFSNELVTGSVDTCFNINDCEVIMENANFEGNNFITITGGELSIINSSFQHCIMPVIKGKGVLNIDECNFIDNYTCININGDVNIDNTVFELSDIEYLDTTTPAFVTCFNNLNVDYSQFIINLEGLTTLGFSYIFFYLGKTGTTNRLNNNTLFENNKFNFLKNVSEINIESEQYNIQGKTNKACTWIIENTNTVYSNMLEVEHV